MKYAKESGGGLLFFRGRILRDGGRIYANPDEKTLKAAGYLPFISENPPKFEDGAGYREVIRRSDGAIVRTWVREENVTDGV